MPPFLGPVEDQLPIRAVVATASELTHGDRHSTTASPYGNEVAAHLMKAAIAPADVRVVIALDHVSRRPVDDPNGQVVSEIAVLAMDDRIGREHGANFLGDR